MEHLKWRKASQSSSNGGECVELAALSGKIFARDSKNPGGGVLAIGVDEMRVFVTGVKRGRYDL